MSEVPRKTTPVSENETAAYFLSVWPDSTREQAELLLAQLWLENARGRAVVNHNWGNLSKAVPIGGDASGDYYRPVWYRQADIDAVQDVAKRERYQTLHARMYEGTVPTAFQAFPDHATGIAAWKKALLTKFPKIVNAAKTGDAGAFAAAQVASGYCPDCGNTNYGSLRDMIRARGYFAQLPSTYASRPIASDGDSGLGLALLFGLGVALLWRTR